MNAENDISEWIRLAEMDLATARHMFNTFYFDALSFFYMLKVKQIKVRPFVVFFDLIR